MIRVCKECSTELNEKQLQFCSKLCLNRYNVKHRISNTGRLRTLRIACKQCGNQVVLPPAKFCSCSCAAKHTNSTRTLSEEHKHKLRQILRRDRPVFVPQQLVCSICNVPFQAKKKTQQYCSRICSRKAASNSRKDKGFSDATKLRMSESRKAAFEKGLPVTGGTTKWYSYKKIRVQGTYELRMCKLLDTLVTLSLVESWDKCKERFLYYDDLGISHTYNPDFVFKSDGNLFYLEVKGFIRPVDIFKWKVMNRSSFVLAFKEDLELLESEFMPQ